MLDNSDSVSDENLFAATIILRMLEEMDGKLQISLRLDSD
jgi:hypothetical protein